MISPHLLELERDLSTLSLEELEWLLERIRKQVQARKQSDDFTDIHQINKQLATMANDLDIKTEIASIHEEFIFTEMDGLEKL
ncbi:hypothetical protein H6G80_16055 [Nostoc sp. FACHB-87]|uniref:hypothetical protein n=1 Tax=Nostocales TaxID=1161 RepID=UPI0016853606|nr:MULTISPECIES: hypothetical protein [Nostocales]MBD2300114.1 hypothetical protein [Nostoc sp. FACHB-190]MBD2455589.1 hypothetical protein [Nostoc sp. FACHB-87]MBD2477445.1 hypothetical protein [Anabaena sp. FACHB-83]MBD2487711.1 hypothetical protein [Aulosira sp. FACHB-615]